MKQEIVEFYEKKNIPISLMIHKWRPIPAYKIKHAAEVVYNEIQDGLVIKNIAIAGRVRSLTETVDGKKYKTENTAIEEGKRAIANLTKDRDFWKAKHGHLVGVLNDKDSLIRLGIEKRRRVSMRFAVLYAVTAWLWTVCEIARAF